MRCLSFLFLITIMVSSLRVIAQVTTEPAFPTANDDIRIIYDATKGTSGLVGAAKVYMHSGVILDSPTGTSWQNVVGNWGKDDGIGLMTKVAGETDKWEITINPRIYFNVPTAPIYRIGMVFRNADGSKEGKTDANTDIFVNLLQGGFDFYFTNPTNSSLFVNNGDNITITATASSAATFTLNIGGVDVDNQAGITNYSYIHTVTETSGSIDVTLTGTDGSETVSKNFSYVLRSPVELAARPAGIKKGINYIPGDNTRVILCLQAPTNSSAYVEGDFTNWKIDPNYQMKKDGEYFWLEVTGLTSGVEYAFRYIVDEDIFIADPYSDKILDPDDRFISSSIYPNLIPFPENALESKWYFNRLSVIQTGQTEYQWLNNNFVKPNEENLTIYETLIRDFFGPGQETYANLKDTLSYFKNLGINAIELMPITEFASNDNWGYDNIFMFAPDKAYGPKNKLKEFIDAAHGAGIAVILDLVMNHENIPSPLLLLDFNYSTSKPNPTNPWFNVNAPHSAISFFYDFNHNSPYTQNYLDSITYYWIHEYHFDGYRVDFSKGFTQKFTSSYETLAAYDPGRVAILKRMANKIWSHTPDAYVILEHFGDNSEETDLANAGMMLWGNMQYAYKQNALGYSDGSGIDWAFYGNRGWSTPRLVGYMESHDEQRMMYESITYSNQSGFYNGRDLQTALQRMKGDAAFFFLIPGPKMIYEFEELGYDIDKVLNGNTGRKPVPWDDSQGIDYYHSQDRQRLKDYFSTFIALRNTYSIFSTSDVTITGGNNLLKQITLKNQPYTDSPSSADEMNVVLIGNFDIISKNLNVTFPHTGTWYNYFVNSKENSITSTSTTIELAPGQFRLYTDYELPTPELVTAIDDTRNSPLSDMIVYPNPVQSVVNIGGNSLTSNARISIYTITGKKEFETVQDLNKNSEINLSFLPAGIHILVIDSGNNIDQFKIIKE